MRMPRKEFQKLEGQALFDFVKKHGKDVIVVEKISDRMNLLAKPGTPPKIELNNQTISLTNEEADGLIKYLSYEKLARDMVNKLKGMLGGDNET